MIFVLGKNSFIALNLIKKLLQHQIEVICFSHTDHINYTLIKKNDIIINCTGVNRASQKEEFWEGNFNYVKSLVDQIKSKECFFFHFSSLLVCKHAQDNDPNMFFIQSKKSAEEYIQQHLQHYFIIRPCNIFGYNCSPYYNNLLISLIHESITGVFKIKSLNENSWRYHLHVQTLVDFLFEKIQNINFHEEISSSSRIFNIISSEKINTKTLCSLIFKDDKVPYDFLNGDMDNICFQEKETFVTLAEDLELMITHTKKSYQFYYDLIKDCPISECRHFADDRGGMVEISDLKSERLYYISINSQVARGNHYHEAQIEEFYIANSPVLMLLRHYQKDVVFIKFIPKNFKIKVSPFYIHTLYNVNAYDLAPVECFVSSTQMYIPSSAPDTNYIDIFFKNTIVNEAKN